MRQGENEWERERGGEEVRLAVEARGEKFSSFVFWVKMRFEWDGGSKVTRRRKDDLVRSLTREYPKKKKNTNEIRIWGGGMDKKSATKTSFMALFLNERGGRDSNP